MNKKKLIKILLIREIKYLLINQLKKDFLISIQHDIGPQKKAYLDLVQNFKILLI